MSESTALKTLGLKAAALLSITSTYNKEPKSPPRPPSPETPTLASTLYRRSSHCVALFPDKTTSPACLKHPFGCFDCYATDDELEASMDRTTMGEKEESKKDSKTKGTGSQ